MKKAVFIIFFTLEHTLRQNRSILKLDKNKKSQSIAINTIIFAAIALAVLVVTFLIFTGQFSSTSKTLQSCELKNGKCAESNKKDPSMPPSCDNLRDNLKDYKISIYISDPACGDSKLCCIKIG